MSLRGIAKDTLQIIDAGGYVAPSGRRVSLQPALQAAVAGSRTWTPEALTALLPPPASAAVPPRFEGQPPLRIEVTGERTQQAAHRLVVEEGESDLVLLNFASARNVGGGFLNGARAQEEDLMRCSGLYACVREQTAYYAANREQDSMLYTDHLIHSPGVPFFRLQNRDLLEEPYLCGVITGPAPNAGQARMRDADAGPAVVAALRQRAWMVLALAEAQGHGALLLGAWGCGVFLNDPAEVARAFADGLRSDRFRGAFRRVVFAVYDHGRDTTKEEVFRAALRVEA